MQLQPGNLNTNTLTKTTNFFNNYFLQPIELDQNINDSILSYFEQFTGNRESAKLLVQTVIETAKKNRENPLSILEGFQKMQTTELNAVLAIYLNSVRVNTSFLGVKKNPKISPYIERSIIA